MSRISPHILIVEDDPEIASLEAAIVIHMEGAVATIVGDGAAAMARCERERYDLIILDLWLPRMRGEEVLNCLAADPNLCGIPVIVVSAYTDTLWRTPQVVAVFRKPFDITRLQEEMESRLYSPVV